MRFNRFLSQLSFPTAMIVVTILITAMAGTAFAQRSSGVRVQISSSGPSALPASSVGGDAVASPEADSAILEGDADNGQQDSSQSGGVVIDRTIAKRAGVGFAASGKNKAKSNPELLQSFDGLTFHDQRFSNNGNQFSVEPPDQGLCAGNGFVVESVNDVLKVFDASGNTVLGTVDLNTFYHYPAAIDRQHGNVRGPSITDPVCYYDSPT